MKKSNFYRIIKKGKLIFVACLLFVLLSACLAGCSAFEPKNIVLDSMKVEAVINSDGSADIEETHEANFPNRGKVWWNYNHVISTNGNSLASIPTDETAVKMSVDGVDYPMYGSANLDDGTNYETWKTKLSGKSYYYKNGENLELGVVMPSFSSGAHTIVFKYKVKNIIMKYNDVNVFYYQFVPAGNTMKINKFSANVTFPEGAVAETYAWLHLETGGGGLRLEGNTEENPTSYHKMTIEAEDIPAGIYIETRLTLPQAIFNSDAILQTKSGGLASIRAEEQQWFDDFQAKVAHENIMAIVDIAVAVFAIVSAVGLLLLLLYLKKPKKFPDAPEYLRDIPTDWSVEEAASIFWHYKNKKFTSDMMSATIMNLAKKYYIEIKPGEKKKQAQLAVKNTDKSQLKDCEGIVLGMLEQVREVGTPFTMMDFESWAKSHATYISKQIKAYEDGAKRKSVQYGAYRKFDTPTKTGMAIATVYGIVGVVLLINGLFLRIVDVSLTFAALGLIVGAFLLTLVNRKKTPLTEKGQEQYLKFHALEKYMLDFSNLKEHELPALILWEDYMVWATMMGVADKVSEQLEIAYPEYKEMLATGRNSDMFLLLYLFSPRLRFSMGLNIAANIGNVMSTVQSVQRAAQMSNFSNKFGSSGGGGRGGGGFGGGGGGFGGGGSMGGR